MGINKKIGSIALPSFLGFLGIILFETTDIFWIGKLSGKSVAAVGAASFIHWGIFSLMNLTCTGCSTMVSQYIGAKRLKLKDQVVVESFWLSLGLSLIFMAILVGTIDIMFSYMGLDHETHQLAKKYFEIYIYGLPIIYILNLQGFIFNAYGDTKTVTYILILCLLFNIILDPILIFGWFGFPELGIRGASIATITCEALGIALRFIYLRKNSYIPSVRRNIKIRPYFIKRIFSIGIPSATTNIVWTMVFPILAVTITKFGMDPLAGLNIAHRIEGIPYFLGISFSIAMSSLVGQAIGAKKNSLTNGIVARGIAIQAAIFVPITIAFTVFPHQIISLINSDPIIINHGANYLRIVGYFEIFMGLELLMEGVFNGLGNTKTYMFIRVPLTLLRIPLAYLFAISWGFGVTGVWWAISITTLMKGILLPIIFYSRVRRDSRMQSEKSQTQTLANSQAY